MDSICYNVGFVVADKREWLWFQRRFSFQRDRGAFEIAGGGGGAVCTTILFRPWTCGSPGPSGLRIFHENTEQCHFLLQGSAPTPGTNWVFIFCNTGISLPLSYGILVVLNAYWETVPQQRTTTKMQDPILISKFFFVVGKRNNID